MTLNSFRCCGCGKAALGRVKPCDCLTMVGSIWRDGAKPEYVVFISQTADRRLALSELIKTRLLGVHPEDQDLVLEDGDWADIVAALEGVTA